MSDRILKTEELQKYCGVRNQNTPSRPQRPVFPHSSSNSVLKIKEHTSIVLSFVFWGCLKIHNSPGALTDVSTKTKAQHSRGGIRT